MAKPTRADFAAWLLILGPIPHRYSTSLRYHWIENEMLDAGIIKRIRKDRWHSKTIAYEDWYTEQENSRDKAEQQEFVKARPRERFPQAI